MKHAHPERGGFFDYRSDYNFSIFFTLFITFYRARFALESLGKPYFTSISSSLKNAFFTRAVLLQKACCKLYKP